MKIKKRFGQLLFFLLFAGIMIANGLTVAQSSGASGNEDANKGPTENTAEYAALLFEDTRIHEVDLIISEEDWADLVQNAMLKTKYKMDIVIDGERFQDVSCNTKGNSSLWGVIRKYEGSSRFSLRIGFGSHIKHQTYHGLCKMELNNIYGDSSCMKNAICYDLFRKAGVPSPLSSYVWLKINGKDQGLYLALEDLGKSFLERTAGGEGVLYKPESALLEHGGLDCGGRIKTEKKRVHCHEQGGYRFETV